MGDATSVASGVLLSKIGSGEPLSSKENQVFSCVGAQENTRNKTMLCRLKAPYKRRVFTLCGPLFDRSSQRHIRVVKLLVEML